ncbi:MAG TPA: DUF4386 domain-containing protein [Terriglobales bacterium]|nr:DUF4386 domain-containing protein [Terriglobales bacterium]
MTQRHSRIIGLVYLSFFFASIMSDYFIKGLIVKNDAQATVNNILAHEALFRAGIATGLIETAFYVALVALFYHLFRPVSHRVSVLAGFFGLVGCAIQASGSVFEVFLLALLQNPQAASLLRSEQLPAVAALLLNLNDATGEVALIFFGAYCLLIGCLILRSFFLPRILGILMVIAGSGWLTFLYPPLANAIFAVVAGIGIIAASLMLWLLVMGVKSERWLEQARGEQT